MLLQIYDHLFWAVISGSLYYGVMLEMAFYNSLQIIPDWMIPLHINLVRGMQAAGTVVFFLYGSSIVYPKSWDRLTQTELEVPKDGGEPSRPRTFSFISAICRLSFSIYMCNYLLIRTEFFIRRDVFPFDWFLIFKRMLSTTLLIFVLALVYHLFFVAPFNSIRKLVFDGKKKTKTKTKTN